MVLGMYHKNFKHLPWLESIEVARPTICGFDTQKSCGLLRYRPWTNGTRIAAYNQPKDTPQEKGTNRFVQFV